MGMYDSNADDWILDVFFFGITICCKWTYSDIQGRANTNPKK